MNPEEFIKANVRPLATSRNDFDLYMYDEIYDDLFGGEDDPAVIAQKSYVVQNIIDQIKPEPSGHIRFSMQHNGQVVTVHLTWMAFMPEASQKPWMLIMPTAQQLMDAIDESG